MSSPFKPSQPLLGSLGVLGVLLAYTVAVWLMAAQLDKQAGEIKTLRARAEVAETSKAQCLKQLGQATSALERQSAEMEHLGQASAAAKAEAAAATRSAQAQVYRLEGRIQHLRDTAPGPDACAIARQTIINTLVEDRQ